MNYLTNFLKLATTTYYYVEDNFTISNLITLTKNYYSLRFKYLLNTVILKL